VARDSEKCIKCRRCIKVCRDTQTVEAYAFVGKSIEASVGTEFNTPLECTYCGQCTAVCPTAALTEKSQIKNFLEAINDPQKKVAVQIAPSVPFSLGEEFGMPAGSVVTEEMVTALKKIGADLVFNTNLGADLTIMEEAHELIERIKYPKKDKPLPLFTSCCPSWVLFMEQNYPQLLGNLSSCSSPHIMLGSLIKNYYASKNKLEKEKIFTVSIMPCLSKKYEAARPEFSKNGIKEVDCVLTTRELGKLLREKKIELSELEGTPFDSALGTGTSAGAIFGASGGVAEAALRTAVFFLTGNNPAIIDFKEVRGDLGIKIATVKIADLELRVGVVNGLGNARQVLKDLGSGELKLDLLEVMACPGGCIGGGGQPIPTSPEIRKRRAASIYNQDKNSVLRLAHENPLIEKIYKDFLFSPGSKKAQKYLHTKYYPYQYRYRQ
jgi:iron-only hydrogenase group A